MLDEDLMVNSVKCGQDIKANKGRDATMVSYCNNIIEHLAAQCHLRRVTLMYADCRLFQFSDEQMCGFKMTTASCSSSSETVDRLLPRQCMI